MPTLHDPMVAMPAGQMAQRVEAMNEAFGCTCVLDRFQTAYKSLQDARRGVVAATQGARQGCPAQRQSTATACPAGHPVLPHPDEEGVAAKVGYYSKLTLWTADFWEVMEESPPAEVYLRDGSTQARFHFDGSSFETPLPSLMADGRSSASAFGAVSKVIQSYNYLVTERAAERPEFRGMARALGGFDEGFLQLGMIFDAVLREHGEREAGLMSPERLAEALEASYAIVPPLTRLNYFPQKLLDLLIVADINPFSAAGNEGIGAGVRAGIWEFLGNLGREMFNQPEEATRGLGSRGVFNFVVTRLHLDACPPADRGGSLQGLMLELFERVSQMVKSRQRPGGSQEGTTDYYKRIARMLSGLQCAPPRPPYTQADGLLILQRTTLGVQILELAASYHESPENRYTVGCTALRAGVLRKWYTRISDLLSQWYRLEHERLSSP